MLDDSAESQEGRAAWAGQVSDLDALEPVAVPPDLTGWARGRNDDALLSENASRMWEEYSAPCEEYARRKLKNAEFFFDGSHGSELAETVKASRLPADFWGGSGLPVLLVPSGYLPALSSRMQRFARYAAQFTADNPDIVERLKTAAGLEPGAPDAG